MSAPTRYRIAARNRAEAEAMSRVIDRMRDQFPELGEAEIQDAVGGPKSVADDLVLAARMAAEGVDLGAEFADAPRRYRA